MKIWKRNKTQKEVEVERLILVLASLEPTSEEYRVVLSNLETLTKNDRKAIPVELFINWGFTLAQTLFVLYYEHGDVVRSKTFGWINRPKI